MEGIEPGFGLMMQMIPNILSQSKITLDFEIGREKELSKRIQKSGQIHAGLRKEKEIDHKIKGGADTRGEDIGWIREVVGWLTADRGQAEERKNRPQITEPDCFSHNRSHFSLPSVRRPDLPQHVLAVGSLPGI